MAVFCILASGNRVVETSANLLDPGAISLPGAFLSTTRRELPDPGALVGIVAAASVPSLRDFFILTGVSKTGTPW